jgi:hypothetical protein
MSGKNVSSGSAIVLKTTAAERRQSRQVTSTPATPIVFRRAIVGGRTFGVIGKLAASIQDCKWEPIPSMYSSILRAPGLFDG